MISIRRSVFETNSSSSHSIVMTKQNKPIKSELEGNMIDGGWHVNNEGIIDFWFEDDLNFGRSPFELLTDWYGRLRYAIASYSYDADKINDIEEICQRRIAGFTQFKFKKDRWEEKPYRGYVDHESANLLQHALAKFDISLEEFIFNDRYIVVIDGDEYCVFQTFLESDMFNKNSIEDLASAAYGLENGGWLEIGEDDKDV